MSKRKKEIENGGKKRKIQCDICMMEFRDEQRYIRHVSTHKSYFKCDWCDRKFKQNDVLHKHITDIHYQIGRGDNNIERNLPGSHPSPAVLAEHDYSRTTPSLRNNDHDYNHQHTHRDHAYARSSSAESQPIQKEHDYASSTQSALNQSVMDHTIFPSHYDQYDMLTFFANTRLHVEQFLNKRLSNNAMKWYLSIQVEMIKVEPSQQTTKPHFRSRTYATLNLQTFDEHDLNESFQKMFASFEKYVRESSGWVLKKVLSLTVHTIIYSPLTGSSYMELPKKLRRLQSLLNLRNLDNKCFLWSCLASLHPLDSPLVSDYECFEHELNMEGISYPVSIKQINQFEKQNPSLSVNVFAYEDYEVQPIRITKKFGRFHHIDLLLLQSEHNTHYVFIKNINNFLSKVRNTNNYCHFCSYCLHGFKNISLLNDHIPYCQVHGEQKVELPSKKDCLLEFKDFEKTLPVPYVIYADFETINKPISQKKSTSVTQTQLLEPCSFGYKVVSTDPGYKKDTVLYVGKDASKKLLEALIKEAYEISNRLQNIKPLILTDQEEISFQNADRCCICQNLFVETEQKARHHNHTSGAYIGATHMNCNLQCKQVKFVPVVFHNLKNFDAHLLCQNIGIFKNQKVKCIPQTIEKYVSFSLGSLRFIDSFAFLPSSLETLVDNLAHDGKKSFHHFHHEIKDNCELLLRKGVYPYEYMDNWDKFDEKQLPSRDQFHSSLTKETVSSADYEHAQDVFHKCKCQTLRDYSLLYLKTDVLLLADIFENFRKMALEGYGLDPCHFYTSPGLSWQAMLKKTGVTLELMTDIDQILFIERGIRGGVSQISHRFTKANNPYLDDYDSDKETTFLAYYDVNNLYGLNLSEKLPVGFFRFMSKAEIDSFDVENITEVNSKGYILEVDLDYPQHLHDTHNCYPLAPERKFISDENLSPYAQKLWSKLNNYSETITPRAKVEKLLTTLEDKKNYVLHYRNLQLYLQLGMKLKKIHRVLEFEQSAFMKPYIQYNTQMRQQAKTDFEKNFFKLMNNSCFGKTMENLRKHRSVELCHTESRLKKLTAKSTYKEHRVFSEDLVGVELNRNKVKLNKPIYIGFTVLDLSKYTMYDFFYNHLKKVYGCDVQLQMTDTDSFLIKVKTNDIFHDMNRHIDLFDTSDFPQDHFLYSNVNKKTMGKMKSETNEKCISEYCGLRSKMYAFKCENKEDKRAKGISKVVVKNELRFQHYKDTLFNKSKLSSEMNVIRSHDHNIYCEKINKIGLSSFDDKRFLLDDGISSLAYGHYRITK